MERAELLMGMSLANPASDRQIADVAVAVDGKESQLPVGHPAVLQEKNVARVEGGLQGGVGQQESKIGRGSQGVGVGLDQLGLELVPHGPAPRVGDGKIAGEEALGQNGAGGDDRLAELLQRGDQRLAVAGRQAPVALKQDGLLPVQEEKAVLLAVNPGIALQRDGVVHQIAGGDLEARGQGAQSGQRGALGLAVEDLIQGADRNAGAGGHGLRGDPVPLFQIG